MAWLGHPSAASRITLARWTKAWGKLRELTLDYNCFRVCSCNSKGASGRPVRIGFSSLEICFEEESNSQDCMMLALSTTDGAKPFQFQLFLGWI